MKNEGINTRKINKIKPQYNYYNNEIGQREIEGRDYNAKTGY